MTRFPVDYRAGIAKVRAREQAVCREPAPSDHNCSGKERIMANARSKGMAGHESSRRRHQYDADNFGRKEKPCSKCKIVKSIREFGVNRASRGGFRPSCNDCRNADQRAEYARLDSKERLHRSRANAARVKKGRELKGYASRRDAYYRTTYGITEAQVDQMLAAQGARCALCGTDNPRHQRGVFVVDHCHETGRVRGLLCQLCNIALGKLGDTPAAIQRALDYVTGKLEFGL